MKDVRFLQFSGMIFALFPKEFFYLFYPLKNMTKPLRLYLRSIGCFFIFTSLFYTSSGQSFTPKYNVKTSNNSYGYYEYLPEGYNQGSQNYPLLIFCHGLGELGDGSPKELSKILVNGVPKLINQGTFPASFNVNGQTFKFIVLCPQFKEWPEYIELDDIINYALEHYRVDPSRIYLTGLSMGGGVVWGYIGEDANYGQRIAAAVPVCGACWPANFRCENIAAADVPVWATHNDNDPQVPSFYTVDFVNNINNKLNQSEVHAKKTLFNSNSHDAWSETYNLAFKQDGLNVFEWMLQFTRKSVLPVTGLEFSIKKNENAIQLDWKTFSEINNRGFVIERSVSGNTFDSIGYMPSRSTGANEYSFVDKSPFNGINYYRLRQLDKNGKASFSPVRQAEINTIDKISIFPNPVGDQLRFSSNFDMNNVHLQIIGMGGKTIMESILSGSGSQQVPVNLPPGMYTAVFIKNGNALFKLPFIKK